MNSFNLIDKGALMPRLIAAAWIAAALLYTGAARADIYQWQDDQGVLHFSNSAPNVPAGAVLYMREPPPADPSTPAPDTPRASQSITDRETHRRQAETRLAQANRKLAEALQTVDHLTRQVSRSQAQAASAVRAARQAEALAAERAVETLTERGRVRDRVIIRAVPPAHRHFRHGSGLYKRKHLTRHKEFSLQLRHGRHDRIHNHRIHRRHLNRQARDSAVPRLYRRPFTPRAYGIR